MSRPKQVQPDGFTSCRLVPDQTSSAHVCQVGQALAAVLSVRCNVPINASNELTPDKAESAFTVPQPAFASLTMEVEGGRGVNRSAEETESLILVFGKDRYQRLLRLSSRNLFVYVRIAKDLRENHNVQRSAVQCREKMKKLRSAFTKAEEKNRQRASGDRLHTSPFHHLLAPVLKARPENGPRTDTSPQASGPHDQDSAEKSILDNSTDCLKDSGDLLSQPSTPQPSTPQLSTPQPSTPQPSTPQPSTPQPSNPKSPTLQQSLPRPTTPQPSTHDHTNPQPSIPQPSTPQPSTPQPPTPQTPSPNAGPSSQPHDCPYWPQCRTSSAQRRKQLDTEVAMKSFREIQLAAMRSFNDAEDGRLERLLTAERQREKREARRDDIMFQILTQAFGVNKLN